MEESYIVNEEIINARAAATKHNDEILAKVSTGLKKTFGSFASRDEMTITIHPKRIVETLSPIIQSCVEYSAQLSRIPRESEPTGKETVGDVANNIKAIVPDIVDALFGVYRSVFAAICENADVPVNELRLTGERLSGLIEIK